MHHANSAGKIRLIYCDADIHDLWAKFRNGDRDAFAKIYRSHIDGLYHYGMNFCGDQERVKDCLQDLFKDIWADRSHLSPEVVNLRYYLLTSLRRRLLRSLQKDRKQHLSSLADSFDFEIILPQENTMILDEIYKEKLMQLHKAIALLSRRQREVIYLRFFQDLSYADIAELMSLQIDSVYNLISKALGSMKKDLSFFLR